MGSLKVSKMAKTAVTATGRRPSEACDNAGDKEFGKFLSSFQIEKFTYMFNSFFDDSNGDGLLQKEDVDALIERLTKYRGWNVGTTQYNRVHDVLYSFYDCLCFRISNLGLTFGNNFLRSY